MDSLDIVTGDDPFVHPETRSKVKRKRKSKKQQ
jgi:hypothetical protein